MEKSHNWICFREEEEMEVYHRDFARRDHIDKEKFLLVIGFEWWGIPFRVLYPSNVPGVTAVVIRTAADPQVGIELFLDGRGEFALNQRAPLIQWTESHFRQVLDRFRGRIGSPCRPVFVPESARFPWGTGHFSDLEWPTMAEYKDYSKAVVKNGY